MLKKIQLQPGINREGTDYSSEGSWYSSDKIRFRKGFPEKIGGWKSYGPDFVMKGFCRTMKNWSSLNNDDYMALGTNRKAYIEIGGSGYDITPERYKTQTTLRRALNNSDTTGIEITADNNVVVGDIVKIEDTSPPDGQKPELMYVSAVSGSPTDTIQVSARGGYGTIAYAHGNGSIVSAIPFVNPSDETSLAAFALVDESAHVLVRAGSHGVTGNTFIQILSLGATFTTAGIADDDLLSNSGLQVSRVLNSNNYEIELGTAADVSGTYTSTDLTSTLAAGGSSISLTNVDNLSTNDFIKVDSEYIKLGAKTGTTGAGSFAVTRAQFGSVAAEHVVPSGGGGNPARAHKLQFVGGVASSNKSHILYDINSVSPDSSASSGWGASPWGQPEGWGVSYSPTSVGTDSGFGVWSIDNWGEDLIICRSMGDIYYWDKSRSTTPTGALGTSAGSVPIFTDSDGTATLAEAVPFSKPVPEIYKGTSTDYGYGTVPSNINKLMVYPGFRTLIAFGCDGIATSYDPMLVRWSDEGHPASWRPTSENSAGGKTLNSGSYIVSAGRTKRAVLIWTDESVYLMQFTGGDFIFGISELSKNISIIGPNAYCAVGNTVYWMDSNNFYMYDGAVKTVPCSVLDYVFGDFNTGQKDKCFAADNSGHNEIIFFYASESASEINRYASYNYEEGVWALGNMTRTAWNESGIRGNPQASYVVSSINETSGVYTHEVGWDADGAQMDSYVESAYFDIEDGDRAAFVSRVIPDLDIVGGAVDITISSKNFPSDPNPTPSDTSKVARKLSTGSGGQIHTRIRGRQLSVKFSSSGHGTKWRLGGTRIDVQPDGGR